jgi:hypothetical protein
LKIRELKQNDPVQKRVPFLESLVDNLGEPSKAAEMLSTITFDALSTKNKKKKVGYMELGDTEMVQVELAHFVSSGFKSPEEFGFFKLPTPSDSTNISFVRMEKHSRDTIIEGILEIALGEIERINILKQLEDSKDGDDQTGDPSIKRVANHNKRAMEFIDLPFLKGKINPLTILDTLDFKEIITEEISQYLDNEFLNSQIAYYEKLGIIKPFNKKVITEKRLKAANKYGISSYIVNNLMTEADIKKIDSIIEKAAAGENAFEAARPLREKYVKEGVPIESMKRPLQFTNIIKKDTFPKLSITEKAYTKLGINKSLNTDEKHSEFFKSFLLNAFYSNMNLGLTLAGSTAFYSSSKNQQKRFKQHVSPGTYPAAVPNTTMSAMFMEDSMVPTRPEFIKESFETIIDPSKLTDAKKREIKANWGAKSMGEKGDLNNETDGATLISVDAYLNRLDSLSKLTKEHIEAAKRIKKGEERLEDIALFPPLKPHLFTKYYTKEGFEVPLQIKDAEFILTKKMAYTPALNEAGEIILEKDENGKVKTKLRYPKLAVAYDILNKGIKRDDGSYKKVDMISFVSAVKVGQVYDNIDADGNGHFADIQKDENGDYQLTGNGNTVDFNAEDWKHQMETPPHYYDKDAEGNVGSQGRFHIIADADLTGEYTENHDNPERAKKRTGQELIDEFQDNVVYNIKKTYEDVEKLFLDDNGKIDYTALEKVIQKEIRARNLGDSYMKAIKTISNKDVNGEKVTESTVPYWNPNISYKIFSILTSVFKNNVTKQKNFGGQMVNASSFGVSDELKIKVDKKTGGITFEALLPWDTKKYFPKDKNGEVDLQFLKDNAPELLRIIGYRIPTEDKYSMFNIEIVGFTDVTSGGSIILPVEAPFIAGLDFDIDKLFMIKPRYYLKTEGGKKVPKYIKPINEGNTVSEIVDHVFRTNLGFKEFLKTYYPQGFKIDGKKYTVDGIADRRNELLQKNKDLNMEHQDMLKLLEATLRDAKKLKTANREALVKMAEKELNNFIEELERTDTPFDEDKEQILRSMKTF